jgi:hypothetical protein
LQLSFTSPINLTGEIIMFRQHYLETTETVLAWDLPEEVLPEAIHQQVRLMPSVDDEEVCLRYPDYYLSH